MADPMPSERLEEFAANAPEVERGELWSLLDWSFWGAGMADVFREPLADTMLAAIPADASAQAEAIMADFIRRREIEKTGVTIYQEQRDELERLREQNAQQSEMLGRAGHVHNGCPNTRDDVVCPWCRVAELEAEAKRTDELGAQAIGAEARAVADLEAEVERLRKERDGLREQLHRVKTVRVWTNEDGKRFVFGEDLVAAVDGGATS